MDAEEGQEKEPQRVAEGVFDETFARLAWLMRTKYARVLEANRRFEEETNFNNKIGAYNLADALSHIGTIFEKAEDLDLAQQRAQVTLIEDHLRRSMMEAWEQMHVFQVGRIDQLEEEQYLPEVKPLIEQGLAFGAPAAEEIEKLRAQCNDRVHRARATKREVDWDEWEKGTDLLIEACELASRMRKVMQESIAAAQQYRREEKDREIATQRHDQGVSRDTKGKRIAITGICASLATAALIFGLQQTVFDDAPPQTSKPQPGLPVPVPAPKTP